MVTVLAAILDASEDEGGGIGEVIFYVLIIGFVLILVAALVALLPVLFAMRHGWRWAAVVALLSWLCSAPFRFGLNEFYDDPSRSDPWVWLSFPMWIGLAIVARRGPPKWLRFAHRTPSPTTERADP